MKNILNSLAVLVFFFSSSSWAMFKKVKLETVNVTIELPARLQGGDWVVVENSASGNSRMSSRIEFICTISSPDIFLGRTSGILRAIALVKGSILDDKTIELSSLDTSKPFHESRSTGLTEKRHSCYIQGHMNVFSEKLQKMDVIQFLPIGAGEKWKLSNEELQALLDTAYIN